MLSDSMPTSKLNSERIPYPPNTLVYSQTRTGPSTPMVYFVTWVGFMSQALITFSFIFSNIHMITPLQDYCRSSVPKPNPCTTNLMDFSSNSQSQEALEFYLHRFHREASTFLRLHL